MIQQQKRTETKKNVSSNSRTPGWAEQWW